MGQQVGWRARDHDGEVVESGDLIVEDDGSYKVPNLSHLPVGSYTFEMDPIQMAGERIKPTGRPRVSRRESKRQKGRRHQRRQRQQLELALEQSREASKRAKKGSKGVEAQMNKRGYYIDGRTGAWRRMTREEQLAAGVQGVLLKGERLS